VLLLNLCSQDEIHTAAAQLTCCICTRMWIAAAAQFDTLLKQVEQEELVAILGHELGHWKLSHTLRNFAVTQVYLFLALAGEQ
jgi:Peptidase family M48